MITPHAYTCTPWGLPQHMMGENDFTWDEIEAEGVAIHKLREGEWFAFVGGTEDGKALQMYTGQVACKCLRSVLVQLDRGWDDRLWWSTDAKVIRLPHPNEGKRVSLTKFTENEE